MKVAIYLQTASSPLKHKVLECFGQGIQRLKRDKVAYISDFRLVKADVAVILGYYGLFKPAIHDPTHKFRKKIYDFQIKNNKNIIFIDRDFFCDIGKKVNNQTDPHHFFRVSMGSIYFNEGLHFNHIKMENRWKQIKRAKRISIPDNVKTGNKILVCLNNGEFGKSWATKKVEMLPWAAKTVEQIRERTDDEIIVRFHPKIKPHLQSNIPIEIFDKYKNITFTGGIRNDDPRVVLERSMMDDVKDSRVSVFYNSSASIVPALYGYPIITEQVSCPAYAVANHSIDDVINPKVFDKKEWLEELSNCLWSTQEMKKGLTWNKFKKFMTPKGDLSKKSLRGAPEVYNKYIKYYYRKF